MRTQRDPLLRPYLKSWRQIAWRLNGVRPPPFSPTARSRLLILFCRIHSAYVKAGLYKGRASFLSFPFTYRRCLEILGLDRYKEYFPGLRCWDKYLAHYRLYRKVCAHLKIPVIVSSY